MPVDHQLTSGEQATFDPGAVAGPYTFTLPNTALNGSKATLKATKGSTAVVTLKALNTASIEDPLDEDTTDSTISFVFRSPSAVTWTYNAGADRWQIYDTGHLGSDLMRWFGTWNVATKYYQNDLVRHGGGLWACEKDNVGVEPDIALLITTQEWIPLYYPGSGGANQQVPQVIGTINAVDWFPIEIDTETLPPSGCSFDFVTDTYQIEHKGVWQETVSLFFSHNETQGSRTIQLRLWDGTSELGAVTIGVGRNVSDSSASISLLNRIITAQTNLPLQWQIGGPSDPVTDVTITGFALGLIQVSV